MWLWIACVYVMWESERERTDKKIAFVVTIWKHVNKTPIKVFIYLNIQYFNWNSKVSEEISFINKYSVIICVVITSSLTMKKNKNKQKLQQQIQLTFYCWRHYFWGTQSCSFPKYLLLSSNRIISWYSPFMYVYLYIPCMP